jgi:flagellar hook-associated protein 3 FlgL
MITDLSPAYQNFLSGLDQIRQKLQTSQIQLTTGLKINQVSDDPTAIADLWQSRSELDQATQIDSNLGQVSTEVNTAQTALESAVTLMQRAETLGTQGATDTASATTRIDLAGELGAVLQELVAGANTSVQNRFIFAGDADQTTPYTIDLTQNPPVISAYQGSTSTRQIQSPDGTSFGVALSAQQIFDSPDATTNVFSSITNLIQGLLNNDDTAINSSIGDVQSADTYLNQQLAFYGATSNRITDAQTFGQNYTTQLQTQISGIEDANEAQSITELTQAQTQLQAALQSESSLPKTTLFDFLG